MYISITIIVSSSICNTPYTVGFHNFNLRIFNLRVSNPNELTVDVFLTRCRISMCQGLGPKKHDEISETDRNTAGIQSNTNGNGARPQEHSSNNDDDNDNNDNTNNNNNIYIYIYI